MSSIQFSTQCEVGYFVRPRGYFYPIGLTLGVGLSNVAPLTTGGTITADGSGSTANMVHSFTTSDTFTAGFTGNVELLVVAGGGGGSGSPVTNYPGGGGGAGGFRYCGSFPVTQSTNYTVIVGAGGGIEWLYGIPDGTPGMPGSNSCFSTFVSHGGGGSGRVPVTGAYPGGSGGGGIDGFGGAPGNNPPFSPPQGNPGGASFPGGAGGGGGGGACCAGGNASPTPAPGWAGGCGGNGCTISISGSSVTYAGGGAGGGIAAVAGTAGTGGGGCGSGCTTASTAGTANRGGGGGGGGGPIPGLNGNPRVASAGGSGIVIVRYVANSTTPVYSVN